MEKSQKNKTAHDIYYGIDQSTGDLRHISEVSSGEKCGCKCIECGIPLIARKGIKREHHFAHVSNNACAYSNEVVTYLIARNAIRELSKLHLPPIIISSRYEELARKETQDIPIDDDGVKYVSTPNQYPPVLKIAYMGHEVRILFDFGDDYRKEQLDTFEEEAREGGYSTLLFRFPEISNDVFFRPENLKMIFTGERSVEFEWLRSAWRDDWLDKHPQIDPAPPAPEPLLRGEGSLSSKTPPTEAELAAEEARIKGNFDPASVEECIDKFDRRWFKCEQCGEIKLEKDIADHGGRRPPTLGLCSKCAR